MTIPESIDGYRVVEQIGAGSSSVVYKVEDSKGQIFALKLFHVGLNLSGSQRKRFMAEARTLEKIRSARVARLFKVGEADNSMYLLMELVEGKPLDVVIENGPLTGLQLQSTISGLVEALVDTHESGITHRDIKPANIILGPEGVKLIDFGLSAVEDANASTRSVVSGGTPAWLSPEQAIGKEVGPSSDVFSLGLVIAFLAVGRNPFGQGKPDALIYRIVNEEPDLDSLTGNLRTLVEYCLKKEPLERPNIKTISEAVGRLANISGDSDSTTVASATMIEDFSHAVSNRPKAKKPLSKSSRRWNRSKIMVSAGLATALVLGFFTFFPARGEVLVDYRNSVGSNIPTFDSYLQLEFGSNSTRQIDLPTASSRSQLQDSFTESVGDWRAGEEITFSIVSEIEDWSTNTSSVEFPRFFSLFRTSQPYVLTLIVTDAQFEFHESWGPLNDDYKKEETFIAFAARNDESAYKDLRLRMRSECLGDETTRIERLVGGARTFSSEYSSDKTRMMAELPETLSAANYRSRLYGLADKMFDRQLSAVSPEMNGNDSQLSDAIIFAVRDVYTAHFNLLDMVEWVGDTMVNDPRGYGYYHEMYAREFASWDAAGSSLATASNSLRTAIRNQAEYVCNAEFPELD